MRLLTHHDVSLHRHVQASFATAFVTATLVSLLYCALLTFAGTAMGRPEVTSAGLVNAFGQSWLPTAIFSLAMAAVVFSVMRMALNRIGGNVGFYYVLTGAVLVAIFMAFAQTLSDGLADFISLILGAGIGLSIGLFYWLFASRGAQS